MVCGSIAEKYAGEVVAVKLSPAGTRPFHADAGSEHLKVGDVRLLTIPGLIWGDIDGGVDKSVVKLHCMKEGSRPEFRGKPRAVEQCLNFDSEGIIVDLSIAILGRAIGPGWFDNVAKFTQAS